MLRAKNSPGPRGRRLKGKGKEELIKSALVQKRASKYWIKCKDTQSRERKAPPKQETKPCSACEYIPPRQPETACSG